MNKQFCGFDLGNSKVHWELSEKNALNSFFFFFKVNKAMNCYTL